MEKPKPARLESSFASGFLGLGFATRPASVRDRRRRHGPERAAPPRTTVPRRLANLTVGVHSAPVFCSASAEEVSEVGLRRDLPPHPRPRWQTAAPEPSSAPPRSVPGLPAQDMNTVCGWAARPEGFACGREMDLAGLRTLVRGFGRTCRCYLGGPVLTPHLTSSCLRRTLIGEQVLLPGQATARTDPFG